MKKILLICVNYKSDDLLHKFVESIHRAAGAVKDRLQVDILIADNSKNNLGYLGGALEIYNKYAGGYEFVSISNVDLELTPHFFEALLKINTQHIGWIAPDIYTAKNHQHENPFLLSRPTKYHFAIWNTIYSSTLIYRIYHSLHLLKNSKQNAYPACDIYAGHGSFMLFTQAFVQQNPTLFFPGFMYGEEIYMAELVRATKLKVVYAPTLQIHNIGNISTGIINQAQKSKWSKESLCAIYKQFFK